MHLKSLTLRGFKSFADKTEITFEPAPSITAIVGPNGCGKSNIIDAIRFVIGEHSMREMRGDSLENLIFAGTTVRKPVSLAEVSMLIDNNDSSLKADYGEVQLKRRVFRSGESEFSINKNSCRLRDIKELFMDTGIGNGAYSIVSQGQVDSILSSKPEERRELFEEAAGIGKYKFRKRAAERRLIGTEQNLLRINDLRNEIRENIASLEVQSQKTREYKEVKARLKIVEVGLAKKQINSLEEKRSQTLRKIDELKNKTLGAEGGVLAEEEEKARLKASIRMIEEKSDELRSKISMARSHSESAKSHINVGRERIFQLGERSENMRSEKDRIEISFSQIISDLINLDLNLDQDYISQMQTLIEEASASRTAALADGNQNLLSGPSRLLSRSQEEIAGLRKEIQELESEQGKLVRKLKDDRNGLESSKNKLSIERERQTQLKERLSFLESDKRRAEVSAEVKKQKHAEISADLQEFEAKYGETKQYLDDSQRSFDETNRHIEESLRGFNSLKNPIIEREMDIASRKHSLAEIELSARFATESLDKEKAFLENLRGLKDDIALLEEELLALESISQEIKDRIISRKSGIFEKIDFESSIIDKNIHALQEELNKINSGRAEAEKELADLESNKNEMSRQFKEFEARMNELSMEKERSIATLAETRVTFRNYEQNFMLKKKERDEVLKDIASIERDRNDKENEITSAIQKLESSSQEEQRLSSLIPALEEEERQLEKRSEEVAGLTKTKLGLLSVLDSIRKTEGEATGKMREIIALRQRISEAEAEVTASEQKLPALVEEERLLTAEIEALSLTKAAEQAKLEVLEEKIRSLTNEDRVIRDALSKEEVAMAKIEGELAAIEGLMSQEYQLTISGVLESGIEEVPSFSKGREEIEALKAKLFEIGPVNLLAMEEFEASKERLGFIEGQYNDLVAARDNLKSLIKELDSEARQKLVATIDEVSVHFSHLFGTLFEGGEAKIELQEGDPLEAGIDIIAKPSGKKWISLALMSGGEKALTAISILFALMKTKPSPFCFMDEVDAPLDEINTLRFTKLLKEFSHNTQIIVITHSKRTMAAANLIYGVTNEEPGVSKVISMKLVKVAD